jgi:hypothetical protein
MGPVDAVPVAAREMQRQMGEFAVKAMDLPLSERDMSGVTMGITHRAYEQIKKELRISAAALWQSLRQTTIRNRCTA